MLQENVLKSQDFKNDSKKFWSLLNIFQPAYNIGGRIVSVEAIQNYILRIKMPRPGQVRLASRLSQDYKFVNVTVSKL